MFYTERTLNTLSSKSKPRNGLVAYSRQTDSTSLPETIKRRPNWCSLTDNSSLVVTKKHHVASDTDKQDCKSNGCACSGHRTSNDSEPKRSRLYFSTGISSSIQQQYSTNSLCEAF